MKNTLIFIVFVLLVLGLLHVISGKRIPPPLIPENEIHESLNDSLICMNCHGPDKDAALKKNHPPKRECFKCHKVKKQGKISMKG